MAQREAEIPPEIQRVLDFHGRKCPGTLLMARLSEAAMEALGVARHDPNLFAYVESHRCHTAGVQVTTGCTYGSRRMIVKEYGRAAVTLVDRLTGRAVRASCRPGFPSRELFEGLTNEQKFERVLAVPVEDYLVLAPVRLLEELPQVGPPTVVEYCDRCGERVLDGLTSEVEGRRVCRGCQEPYYATNA